SPTPVISIIITNDEGYIVQEHEPARKRHAFKIPGSAVPGVCRVDEGAQGVPATAAEGAAAHRSRHDGTPQRHRGGAHHAVHEARTR
ncbi:unnamed protein product, partial [Ixodes pacificus]